MQMPAPDAEVLAKRDRVVAALRGIVPGEGVIASEEELRAYECDGLTAYRTVPMAVVLPATTEQVAAILRYCDAEKVKVVPRGAGTGLSGGALPLTDGIILGLGKFNRILDIDFENRTVTAQSGVTNLGITKAVEHRGFYYAPDPSSQIACTIGGNIAENSGGVHCLKYGLTTNNVLGVELVLPSGEIVRLGGKHLDSDGYDLLGLMTGSEGLLGIVTEVTVRILQKPETARAVLIGFPSVEQGGSCVASIIAAGIIPAGLEMMDRPAINAAEDFCHAGYPRDVEALLICELDGPAAEVDHLIGIVAAIARQHGCHLQQGVGERGRAPALLGRPQERLPRRRPAVARLSMHGRHHPARQARLRAGADAGDVRAPRPARRQRVPRRRRQPAPADPLRRQHPGRARRRRGVRRRYPPALRRGRRRARPASTASASRSAT